MALLRIGVMRGPFDFIGWRGAGALLVAAGFGLNGVRAIGFDRAQVMTLYLSPPATTQMLGAVWSIRILVCR